MNSLLVGQKYIITRNYVDESKKPPFENEWIVEVLGINRYLHLVNVKYLSGYASLIGKVVDIPYNNYSFKFAGSENDRIKEEFMRWKAIESEVKAKLNDYIKIRDEIQTNIKRYKEMEWEVYFLRGAIILIIWLYIKGVIQFV
jgi:hypothetical protein